MTPTKILTAEDTPTPAPLPVVAPAQKEESETTVFDMFLALTRLLNGNPTPQQETYRQTYLGMKTSGS